MNQSDARYGRAPEKLAAIKEKIKHVFVLMLENRSFDHMFGCSKIPGIQVAGVDSNNPWIGQPSVQFSGGAPDPMSTDPGHEFLDVLYQLTRPVNQSVLPDPGHPAGLPGRGMPYPPRTNLGFVENYATTTTEGPVPDPSRVPDIMKGIDTEHQAPALYELAIEFVICDHWFSSLPGPTWPNRYFLHGASSSGLDDSPTPRQVELWEGPGYFRYQNGSIFDQLAGKWRIYHDESGPLLGRLPQVTSIENVHYLDAGSIEHFEEDLKDDDGYPYAYTFIEPSYGEIRGTPATYEGGSSQHPQDGLKAGDDLVRHVYQLIRQSKVWDNSLLIITYDEHGGFYDSVKPGAAIPPGDTPPDLLNQHGFDFSVLGVRVPAILVSPWVQKGKVDSTQYDHSSVPATLQTLFGLPALTARDAAANDLLHLIQDNYRSDCPLSLP